MRGVDFPGAVPFGKPVLWDELRDGPCLTLPVLVEGLQHTSRWTFSDDERKAIAEGADIHLSCFGAQPPVALWVIEQDPREATPETKRTGWLRRLIEFLTPQRHWQAA